MPPRLMLAATTCAALAGGAATASVDRSPPPGGIYRLKPGIYVADGVDCGSPPNAAILRYDGRGLSGAHDRACRATVLARKGGRYTVAQSCVDAGVGPAPRDIQRQVVTVADALTFRRTINGRSTGYRYCPAYNLPSDLRRSAP